MPKGCLVSVPHRRLPILDLEASVVHGCLLEQAGASLLQVCQGALCQDCASQTGTASWIMRMLTAQGLSCGCSRDGLCTVETSDTCRSQEHSQQATACYHAAQKMLRSRPGGCCTPLPFQTALLFAEDQVRISHAGHTCSQASQCGDVCRSCSLWYAMMLLTELSVTSIVMYCKSS